MNSLISFVSKLSFLWCLMLDFKGLLWNGHLIKELAPKQTTTMCSTQTHLIGITNTIITYVSWLPENPEEINGWLQFIPFQHFLLLPGFSGAARISSSVSELIHWSHPNEVSHVSSSTPKGESLSHSFCALSQPLLLSSLFSTSIWQLSFYVFISLLPLVINMATKKNKIMLFFDPFISSTIWCLFLQISLKRNQHPLAQTMVCGPATLGSPEPFWDMQTQDLRLSFPPNMQLHSDSRTFSWTFGPVITSHNWPRSLLHSNALISLHMILSYGVAAFCMALNYIHLQLTPLESAVDT